MKFRAKLVDVTCIQQFTNIVGTIAKLIKVCTLRITLDKLYFILSETAANGGIQIWCELPQGHFCDEYAMQGISAEANEIYVELCPENLLRALKTAQAARWVKLKLTHKHTPCLTVEVELPSIGSCHRLAVHDIPITIVKRRNWVDYAEPEMPNFDVSIAMPTLKILKNVVDKMKNINNFVSLSANQSGEMKLSVETDMVTINTHFKDLFNPAWRHDGGDGEDGQASRSRSSSQLDPEEFAEARIDIRRFAQFLSSQQVNPNRVICTPLRQHKWTIAEALLLTGK
ncbi:checkpoint protein HUS1-like isoform X2 [Babylonia areolata]|uniref:checkpoint protein HUS1-like isoform X2 n=1 Tax=Babylonia areolata TaxID=304850 RepID=UPI003FD2B67F